MWLYRIAKLIVEPLYRLAFRVRVEGAENVPPDGSVILCANHFTNHDPLVLGVTAPRLVSFMAKQELFRNPVLRFIVRGLGAFPVNRGTADLGALKQTLKVLQSGGCFGIFPEGTRNRTGNLKKPEPGVAYIALKSGAPVIPVGISSSYKLFSPIIVKFGKPIDMEQFRGTKLRSGALEDVADAIMAAIGAELVPPVEPAKAVPGQSK